MPVVISFSQTKTLAKIANHVAKKKTTIGVYNFLDKNEQNKILLDLPIEEIWGIGPRLSKRMNALNIYSALDLRESEPKFLKQKFGVVVERIVNELNGISCLPLEVVKPKKTNYLLSFIRKISY
jgi:DNA polymerase V